jgi:hypothetical protein
MPPQGGPLRYGGIARRPPNNHLPYLAGEHLGEPQMNWLQWTAVYLICCAGSFLVVFWVALLVAR